MTGTMAGRSVDLERADIAREERAVRRHRRVDRVNRAVLGLLGFGLVIGAWYLLVASGFKSGLVPSPHETVDVVIRRFRDGDLLADVRASVQRVLLGVGIGVGAAIVVGFVLGWYETPARLFNPVINFFRALPPISLIPLVVVYFGIGEMARTSVLVYAAFFSGVIVIFEGIRALDPLYLRAGRALGASQFELFRRVVLPLSLPTILVALRVALGVSWATLVAAELIAAQQGLGAVIQEAGSFLRVDVMYGGIILIGLAALTMDGLLRAISNRVLAWREEVRA